MANLKWVNGVFEGGGVKGIGLVGALEYLEEQGIGMRNVVGTSAGAIVAALVAAGYDANQLRHIMQELDYQLFKDRSPLDKVPLIGPTLSLLLENGIYEGDYLERWMRDLLARSPRRVRTFKDLHMEGVDRGSAEFYRLQVVATDLTRRKMLVLPHDIADFGRDPDALDVAWAVRMSMSIPFYFEPVRLQDALGRTCYIVDGGVLSNFPVEVIDDGISRPQHPTIGLKLVEQVREDGDEVPELNDIRGPISLFSALFTTMMDAHDARHVRQAHYSRTIAIPTLGVSATDFELSRETSEALRVSGRESARKFLERWDSQQSAEAEGNAQAPLAVVK